MTTLDLTNVSAIRFTGHMLPIGGVGSPVSPPTYITDEKTKTPRFALSDSGKVPVFNAQESSWDIEMNDNGKRVTAPSVVVNSIPAEARRIITAITENQDMLGVTIPGFYVSPDNIEEEELLAVCQKAYKKGSFVSFEAYCEIVKQELHNATINSATVSHRHADALIRHATNANGKQIWADTDSEEYKLITRASKDRGELLYRYFPMSMLSGFWLSIAAPKRESLARSLTSIITGYNATPFLTGTTKTDDLGGVITETTMIKENGALVANESKDAKKPSEFGLGQIPSAVKETGFVCDTILRETTISLTQLRTIRFPEEYKEYKNDVLSSLSWLAIFGVLLDSNEMFLRSGCSLINDPRTSTWQFLRPGETSTVTITIDDAIENFHSSYDRLPEELKFADPIFLGFPKVFVEAIAQRVSDNVDR